MATAGIRAHIEGLSPTTIFTTRDVLKYGKRGAVDQYLYILVKRGTIRRLARGVFVQDKNVNPSIEEIAQIKAAAFARRICKNATEVLCKLALFRQTNLTDKSSGKTFAINGRSSSFQSYRGAVIYKGIAQRRLKLCDSKTGEKVYALWHLRDDDHIERAVNFVFRQMNRAERLDLRACSSLMPGWLNDMFVERFVRTLAA